MTNLGLDYNGYISGKKQMDKNTAEKLLDYELNQKTDYVKKNFPGLKY